MRPLLFFVLLLLLSSCETEKDYCRAFCQRAGECENCGGSIDMDGCINECADLETSVQKKLTNCYKGGCENIFNCAAIIGQQRPSPCYK